MASSKLTKLIYTHVTKLKLLDTEDAKTRFRLKESPFDGIEDSDQVAADKRQEFIITGQIFPKSAIYCERSYLIEIKLTSTFPTDPPLVRFLTPIYHPNVKKDGSFCTELLLKNVKWTPDTSLVQVIEALVLHIDNPDIDRSRSFDLGKEYQENRAEFNRKASEYVREHGLPR